jgi:hypothetical protein
MIFRAFSMDGFSGTGKALFWISAVTFIVLLTLNVGIWKQTIVGHGPFSSETASRGALLFPVPPPAPAFLSCCLGSSGDDNSHPQRSDLKLWVNGHPMGPPHSQHEDIRNRIDAGFSHWGAKVIFSLPPAADNSENTEIKINYSLRPYSWLLLLAILLTTSSGVIFQGEAVARIYGTISSEQKTAIRRTLIIAPYKLAFIFGSMVLLFASVFLAVSLYALLTGWTLPTTALLRWSETARAICRIEPLLGYVLMTIAAFGVCTRWLTGDDPRHHATIVHEDERLRRAIVCFGIPMLTIGLWSSDSAMWSGMVRPGDYYVDSIGGLIPFADAVNYLATSYDQQKDGLLSTMALRRPIAGVFRLVLLFAGGYAVSWMILLQSLLMASAIWFATISIAAWRGVWAALTFAGLAYIYSRTFAPTTLTEPLGLIVAMLSVPYLIESFRSGSVNHALMGFALTVLALMIRMGSMFTIPALMIWLVWQFEGSVNRRTKLGIAAAAVVVLVIGFNTVLQELNGPSQASTGSNFAYVVCGLTMGTTWDGCPRVIKPDAGMSEEILIARMKAMAWDNFKAHPELFFRRLMAGAAQFLRELPDLIWGGVSLTAEPWGMLRISITLICCVGLFHTLLTATSKEKAFWLLMWLSVIASSALIFFDDGRRVLAVSIPTFALFFASGMGIPTNLLFNAQAKNLLKYGVAGLLSICVIFLITPWLARRIAPSVLSGSSVKSSDQHAVIFGSKRIAGFLVVADDQPLPEKLPAIHAEQFSEIVRHSGVETFQGLIHPDMPPLPFGFIFAPRIDDADSSDEFIVPAQVLERRDINSWQLQYRNWQQKPGFGPYWFYTEEAHPFVTPDGP